MAETPHSIARHEDRHSHISIGLRYRVHDQWEPLDALGWNEVGFNFYLAHEIHAPVLELKRGLARFEGTIVWSSLNTGDEVLLAALVNELIFKRAKEAAGNAALHKRLLTLIRVPGMVPQKRSVLASMGLDLSDAKLGELVAQRKLERPMFHYGVKVDSEAWRAIVQKAFSLSSVVLSMEKWSQAFSHS